jgi:hypothetical protein
MAGETLLHDDTALLQKLIVKYYVTRIMVTVAMWIVLSTMLDLN